MSEKEPTEAQLSIKDRMNVPFLLASQILTIQKSMLVVGHDAEKEIVEGVKGLMGMIPTSWKDGTFEKDLENAKTKVKVDVRPEFCGNKASLKFCEKHNITPFVEKESIDYFKVMQTCIDQLCRLGMMGKTESIEKFSKKKEWNNGGE